MQTITQRCRLFQQLALSQSVSNQVPALQTQYQSPSPSGSWARSSGAPGERKRNCYQKTMLCTRPAPWPFRAGQTNVGRGPGGERVLLRRDLGPAPHCGSWITGSSLGSKNIRVFTAAAQPNKSLPCTAAPWGLLSGRSPGCAGGGHSCPPWEGPARALRFPSRPRWVHEEGAAFTSPCMWQGAGDAAYLQAYPWQRRPPASPSRRPLPWAR